ncbi:unnamed protein product [Urochloa decumbens]|uniref:Uncharacterized protein n=1 Tax=Urochloa decumbens TaxID=240449 RepID=A0ABC9FD15_9POAL
MSRVARLKLPKIGGTRRRVSSATRHVSFILARSSHVRASPSSPLLSAISSCSRTMAASVSGSSARCRTMNVKRTEDVSLPATRVTMALSTISSSLSSRAPRSSARLRRHATRSLLRDASPRSSLASVSRVIPARSRRALALDLRLRLNAVSGRFTGTAHMPSAMRAKSPARVSRPAAPRSRPKSSEEMMPNVSLFISGITVTARRPAQCSSRWRRTSPSILPT